ncbi:MAG: dihydrolipoamide acetyltransferase family protein [Spongiibacteraceae bacterium]
MSDFCLPSFGADMEAAKIVEWNVKPGDKFRRGDIIVAVETDKGIIDIEIYDDGIVDQILVEPPARVKVGAVLATYHTEATAPSSTVAVNTMAQPESISRRETETIIPTAASVEAGRKRVSPAARQHARDLNIDIEKIAGTGPHGAVTIEDVDAAAKIQTVAAGENAKPSSVIAPPDTGMRRVIAAAMSRSKREIPHYYLSTTIDMTRALTWLENFNANRPIEQRVVYAVLLLKAVAKALHKTPELNGVYVENSFQPAQTFHIGVAISLRDGGLVLPTLHDVDSKPLPDLMHAFDDLISRARSGHLRASELQDSTITITSLGEQGVESVYPIIYPPQVAIVGFGSIVERPWAIDGMLAVRRVMTATLAADHRVSDGHRGGLFLAAVNRHLQEPESL